MTVQQYHYFFIAVNLTGGFILGWLASRIKDAHTKMKKNELVKQFENMIGF